MRYLKVFSSAVLLSLTFSAFAQAWLHTCFRAQTLMDEATVVVVARPIKEEVIATHPYMRGGPQFDWAGANEVPGTAPEADPKAYVDDVVTTFETLAVVKGAVRDRLVALHHQRFNPPLMTAGPLDINFEPGSGRRYLMFLKQESDGRSVAVSGLLNYADAIAAIK